MTNLSDSVHAAIFEYFIPSRNKSNISLFLKLITTLSWHNTNDGVMVNVLDRNFETSEFKV